ncbi:MAG: hypothetical protein K9L98_01870 [Candidatus Pacebacteria bacterium]|nr:hypothetical protein [Candidatus Paceibacterota bacterium]MCF7862735.1 hypothetical protein [Candidatus Paceibacterota bacterium]
MFKLNRGNVLGLFLGFVVIWFGIQEVSDPKGWVSFVPSFIDVGVSATNLVMIHGVVLIIAGASLILNWYRKWSSLVVFVLLVNIVVTIVQSKGLNAIAVRDIGLMGMALALFLRD